MQAQVTGLPVIDAVSAGTGGRRGRAWPAGRPRWVRRRSTSDGPVLRPFVRVEHRRPAPAGRPTSGSGSTPRPGRRRPPGARRALAAGRAGSAIVVTTRTEPSTRRRGHTPTAASRSPRSTRCWISSAAGCSASPMCRPCCASRSGTQDRRLRARRLDRAAGESTRPQLVPGVLTGWPGQAADDGQPTRRAAAPTVDVGPVSSASPTTRASLASRSIWSTGRSSSLGSGDDHADAWRSTRPGSTRRPAPGIVLESAEGQRTRHHRRRRASRSTASACGWASPAAR